MTTARSAEIARLFEAALDLDAGERIAWLEGECTDEPVRGEVRDLLECAERAPGGFMTPPAPLSVAAASHAHALLGTRISRYEISGIIASGGMGTVYEARQDDPDRVVALKILRSGIGSASALRRFRYEAQILARLSHPHIAQVYEAGKTAVESLGLGAVPYFAMEYIEGARTITAFAAEESLDIEHRLKLFIPVCEAAHYGHQKGVIHRDFKPGNILVDARGQVKVIDFGIARSTDSDLSVTTVQTDVGKLVGTLQYMSPEQCKADPHDLDTRSDVYSLGVVLHELLSGHRPYEVAGMSVVGAARVICEEQPVRLSKIDRSLRGDLETVVLKALDKDRERRYQSTIELAADLRRYLTNEPILARPTSALYRTSKFIKRNKAFCAATLGAFLMLGVAVVIKVTESWDKERAIYPLLIRSFEQEIANSNAPRARSSLELVPSWLRGWEWRYLKRTTDLSISQSRPLGAVRNARLSQEGKIIAAVLVNGTTRIVDALTGQDLAADGVSDGTVVSVAANGQRVAFGHQDGRVSIHDVMTKEQWTCRSAGHSQAVKSVSLNRDGSLAAATFLEQEEVVVWEVITGRVAFSGRTRHDDFPVSTQFSPDGHHLGSLSSGGVLIWDVTTWTPVSAPRREIDHVEGFWFLPGGEGMLLKADDEIVRRSVRDEIDEHRAMAGGVRCCACDEGTGTCAAGLVNGTIEVWSLEGSAPGRLLHGHDSPIVDLVLFDEGPIVKSLDARGTLRTFDLGALDRMAVLQGHEQAVRSVAFSPDGALLVSGSSDKTVRIWDAVTRRQLAVLKGHEGPVIAVDVSPDGRVICSASEDHTVRLWRLFSKTSEELLGHGDKVPAVAFDPSGATLASASEDGTLLLWDVDSAKPLDTPWGQETGAIKAIAFSPKGRDLASGVRNGAEVSLGLRRELNKDVRWSESFGPDVIEDLAYNHNGSLLAVGLGGEGAGVTVMEMPSGRRVSHLDQPSVGAVAFSPDGTRLAACGVDDVHVWDVVTGEKMIVLRGHRNTVTSLAYSPDDTRIASGSQDTSIHIWDTVPFADRYNQRQAALDAQPAAQRLARDRYDELGSWQAVADDVENDSSLDAMMRHAVLSEIIRHVWADAQ